MICVRVGQMFSASILLLLMRGVESIVRPNSEGTCGRRPLDDSLGGRVVGGEDVAYGEIPWQAILKENRFFGLVEYRKCGAVLIDHEWAITAAHCASGLWIFSELIVVLGEHDLSKNQSTGIERKVKKIFIHPKFNKYLLEDDMALIQLEKPVEFDANIQPICLPRKDEDYTGEEGYVSGWGFTTYRKLPSFPDSLKLTHHLNDCQEENFHRPCKW